MKKTASISLVVVIVTLLASAVAVAGRGRGNGSGAGYRNGTGASDQLGRNRGNKGMWIEKAVSYLNLSAEQESAFRALHTTHKSAAAPIWEQLKSLRAQMRTAWDAETPDENVILELHREIHQLRGQLGELRIQLMIDIHGLLTPEQREKMKTFFKGRRGGGRGRGGRGPGRGFGAGPGFGAGAGFGPEPMEDGSEF